MLEKIISKTKGDRWIWLIVIFLSIWSLLAVYSATGTLAYKQGVGSEQFLIKHTVMIIGGLALMYFSHLLDYRHYAGISKVLMIVTIPLLLYTLFFGSNINSASRWVTIPIINQTFQTSDMAKLALITFLARTLSRKQENIKDAKKAFLPIMGSVCGIFILIAPANLSTGMMLFGVSILLLIIGRISIKQIALVCLGGIFILFGMIMLGKGRSSTWTSRVDVFLHPEKASADKSFQANQSKIAIATGGIFGKGPGNSTQRNFLPHPYSDFVFALIIEEYGLIGGLVLVFLYLLFLYRCILIVTQSPKAFGALLAAGLSFSLTIQAFANMAVAVGLGPVTGVPLPLVSMGGTSILFTSIAFGIILSVSRDNDEKQAETVKGKEKVYVGEIPAM